MKNLGGQSNMTNFVKFSTEGFENGDLISNVSHESFQGGDDLQLKSGTLVSEITQNLEENFQNIKLPVVRATSPYDEKINAKPKADIVDSRNLNESKSPSIDDNSISEDGGQYQTLTAEEAEMHDSMKRADGDGRTELQRARARANENLGFVRAYNLSIFSLLGINRSDTGLIIKEIEKIDSNHAQNFHIREFISKFCPKQEHVFLTLWDKFWEVFSRKGRITQQLSLNLALNGSNVYRRSSYLDFFFFLFFFMSIDEKSILEYLFILWYSMAGVSPSESNMYMLAEALWSPVDNAKSIKVLKDVKSVMKKFDKRNFHVSRFKVYDFRAKGAFSSPLLALRKELYKRLFTKSIWRRVIKSTQSLVANPDMFMDSFIVVHHRGRKKTHQSAGERKYANKDINLFTDLLIQYQDIRLVEAEHDELFKQKNYILTILNDLWIVSKLFLTKYVINKILSQQQKVIPASYLVRKKYEKRFAALATQSGPKKINDDEYAAELIQKGILQVPIEILSSKASSAKYLAMNLISKCNNELAAAEADIKEMLNAEATDDKNSRYRLFISRFDFARKLKAHD